MAETQESLDAATTAVNAANAEFIAAQQAYNNAHANLDAAQAAADAAAAAAQKAAEDFANAHAVYQMHLLKNKSTMLSSKNSKLIIIHFSSFLNNLLYLDNQK